MHSSGGVFTCLLLNVCRREKYAREASATAALLLGLQQGTRAEHFRLSATEAQKIVEITSESVSLSRPTQTWFSLEAKLILAYLKDIKCLGPGGLLPLYPDFEDENLKGVAKILSERHKKHEKNHFFLS